MEKWNFRDCTTEQLDEAFDLEQVLSLPLLEEWLGASEEITELEKNILLFYQSQLILNHANWNEQELIQNFIGPVLALVQFTTPKSNAFSERPLKYTFPNGIELIGEVDGLIAGGKKKPKAPYCCIQEFKKENDAKGDPTGQALSAMLVAQALNNDGLAVYGGVIRGQEWSFILLEGNQYAVSLEFNAAKNELFQIFQILKRLKRTVFQRIEII